MISQQTFVELSYFPSRQYVSQENLLQFVILENTIEEKLLNSSRKPSRYLQPTRFGHVFQGVPVVWGVDVKLVLVVTWSYLQRLISSTHSMLYQSKSLVVG